jgi:hypothetical protein
MEGGLEWEKREGGEEDVKKVRVRHGWRRRRD